MNWKIISNNTFKNGKYQEPEYLVRENPELITLRINNSSNLDYFYFSEIYNTSWKAKSNGRSKEIMFNDGYENSFRRRNKLYNIIF